MQINRLFGIIYLLLENRTMTAKALGEHFEVSPRTIYRDVETLSVAGIPIYMSKGKGGGISLLPDFVLNKAVLTTKEKHDLLSSLKAVAAIDLSESNSVLKKLEGLLGEAKNDWIEVDFSTWGHGAYETDLFNQIKRAILSKKVVFFTYASGRQERLGREVEPLKLYYKGGSWYLYGYCRKRADYRFFKLRRIKELQVLEVEFQRMPPEEILLQEDVFQEELIPLTLKLKPELAYRVYDEFESYDLAPDGSFIVTMDYPNREWLFNFLISFGEGCQVLSPLTVRDEMKIKIQAILKNYF